MTLISVLRSLLTRVDSLDPSADEASWAVVSSAVIDFLTRAGEQERGRPLRVEARRRSDGADSHQLNVYSDGHPRATIFVVSPSTARPHPSFPITIATDGRRWRLWTLDHKAREPRKAIELDHGSAEQACVQLLAFLAPLFDVHPVYRPRSPRELARMLAPRSRALRDAACEAIAAGRVPELRKWKRLLFRASSTQPVSDLQVADAYAQTLTHALVLRRFARLHQGASQRSLLAAIPGSTALTQASDTSDGPDATDATDGPLARCLKELTTQTAREAIGDALGVVEAAVDSVFMPVSQGRSETQVERPEPSEGSGRPDHPDHPDHPDPWVHFYEDFLAAYDPRLRKERGVYFTPLAVVRCQVRLVADLIARRLNKAGGFAAPDLTVIDPAGGTGSYSLAMVEHTLASARSRGVGPTKRAALQLAKNLCSFEVMTGPYAVAHLRLGQTLSHAAGGQALEPRVYMSDTLASRAGPRPSPRASSIATASIDASHSQAAESLKHDQRAWVCIGNPPYDRQSARGDTESPKGGWVRHGSAQHPTPLLEDFLRPAREAGAGGQLKNVYNDYVYFWRWALWKVFEQDEGPGIVCFITASSYLKGPGFVGMREHMRRELDELWIIDLEGDSLGARKSENVFAIRSPVAIAIALRKAAPKRKNPARVRYCRLRGSADDKLAQLESVTAFTSLEWQEAASDWGASFVPEAAGGEFDAAYRASPCLTDMFGWQQSGCKAGRSWVVAESPEVLSQRWQSLLQAQGDARAQLFKNSPTGRKLGRAPTQLAPRSGQDPPLAELGEDAEAPPIERYGFRSFDRQWVFADNRLLDRPGPANWRVRSNQQVYLTSLLTETLGTGPAAIASAYLPDLHHFSGRGAKDTIALYRDAEGTLPNVSAELLRAIGTAHGTESPSAEALFAYVYGTLAHPRYAHLFDEALRTPGPRIPISRDPRLFQRLVEAGQHLLWVHTFGERWLGQRDRRPNWSDLLERCPTGCTHPVGEDSLPESFRYDPQTATLEVGDGRFDALAPEVYEYEVSGLRVLRSWLRYRLRKRAGRKSSELDELRPKGWTKLMSTELLEVVAVLHASVALHDELGDLLEEVLAAPLIAAEELPRPSEEQRRAPR